MSANSNGAPRYVILDDMDTLDDDTWWPSSDTTNSVVNQ